MRIAACCLCSPTMRPEQWYDAVVRGVPQAYRMLKVPEREAQYIEEAQRWEKSHLPLFREAFFLMLQDASRNEYDDVLGRVYMEWGSKGGKALGGEFYTPMNLCYMIAKMTLEEHIFNASEAITFNDCSCGSANMMLGSIRVMHEDFGLDSTRCQWVLQDISSIACDMAFINCCLYGVPAVVIHGNSLSRNTDAWHNYYTPWYPIALGNLEAKAKETTEPQPVFEVTPNKVFLKSSKQLEGLLAAQGALFALEMEAV